MIATLIANPHISSHSHSLVSSKTPSIVLRRGTLSDLDSILEIGLNAMPLDPQWDYRFPFRRVFSHDQRDATRKRYQEFLENAEQWSVSIAEIVDNHDAIPIAFAIWDIANLTGYNSQLTRVPALQPKKHTRRDANPKRMQAWTRILREAKVYYFERQYGSQQIQLQILATHPMFQRLGAGSRLVDEGIRLAKMSNNAISVFASPMGRRLYSKLGFKSIASVVVQVKDDPEFVSVEAMTYEPELPVLGPVKNQRARDLT
ncbi:hypothetical protein BU23DRAFT_188644 [Bimuria novae-zelandiae CBS 107.79]|uniref:N-acetyltransferase domain-containing protein n=1 Tax=Bimuria novae-zelandiae CBS 107.79 TaxID=1447943 RepID=A0A6A5VQC7_9PLEO|nr:hypothetical protein BU23DRAFT_188644 [Bimuria novae-zelandiae CBS 107.79]